MPAFAQDLAQGSAPPSAKQTAPGVNGVEDILVTATKRNENLIDVPISMSVLTETAITSAGIDRASEFLSNIPNVTFIQDNAGEVYVNIRGQTSVRNSDPNVAVVIDGATLTSLKSFNQDLLDRKSTRLNSSP